MEFWIVTSLLVAVLFFLITEKIPLDLTSIGIMAVLMLTGILTPEEALRGFSNPSVVTIAAMFILSRSLMRTGALGFVSRRIIDYSRGNEKRILLLTMVTTAVASAFVNNTPVVLLFMTIIMSVCCEYGLSPSKFLIPISYSSILGGISTLIGTSTNLIVSDLSFQEGYGYIRMFELTPLGIPIALLCLFFLYFTAPRLLPSHKAPVCELTDRDAPQYLTEVLIPAGGKLVGSEPLASFQAKFPLIELFEVIRGPAIYFPESDQVILQESDILLVKGTANELVALLNSRLVELPHLTERINLKTLGEESYLVELVVSPQSRLLGDQPLQSRLLKELGIQVIAVQRRGMHYSEQKIRHLRLAMGDVLLVHCLRERLEDIRNTPDMIVMETVQRFLINKEKAPIALAIFAGLIATAGLQFAPISVCAVAAVFLMVTSGCVRLREAYRSVDVTVLMVIAGSMALGTAMEKTGTAMVYADTILKPLAGLPPVLVLSAFILFANVLTELMSNTATAVLLLPIAISTALSLGVNPKAFIIGVCVGASCGFAVPIGYQTHLMVYGPGGYRFRDFLRLGLPVDLITWLAGSALIPIFWPL